MKRLMLITGIATAVLTAVLLHAPVGAGIRPTARIVLLQATGADAKYERIDIQNMGDAAVDLTGWKLAYKSASGSTTTQLLQLTVEPNWHVLLDAGKRETFVSKELAASLPLNDTLRSAEQFTGGMNHAGGGLQLLDGNGAVVDVVGWGTAAETVRLGGAAAAMTSSTWLVRYGVSDDNLRDFTLEPQDMTLHPATIGSLYDVQDVCSNLAEIQLDTPVGYVNTNGECRLLDVCSNIDGVQTTVPEGMEYGATGQCQPIDLCWNIEGIQMEVPTGYEIIGERVCEAVAPVRHLLITELLPNPGGNDDGSEFIELYNADTEPALLSDYQLLVGEKRYALPVNITMQPLSYLILRDIELGLHLANTTGQPLWLVTNRNVEVANVPAYTNAKDDVSWALIDGAWRYTYLPTPGDNNVAVDSLPCEAGYTRDEQTRRCRKLEDVITTSPAPCRDGQYRSEETGRCRAIPVPAVLTPCKEGQYRSEETNRCRSLVLLAVNPVKPCEDDQFRNPLTNRCKRIASSEDVALADCGEGRERNPTTNRCRNVTSVSAPAAAFAVEPVKDTVAAFAGWWAMGGVGMLAVGYAGWEWRHELMAGIAKIRQVLTLK